MISSIMNTYNIVFFFIAITLFLTVLKGTIDIKPAKVKPCLYTLLVVGILLRLILAPIIEGFYSDMYLFKKWSSLAADSLSNFYSSTWCDYPPFYIYILSIIGKIVGGLNLTSNPDIYVIVLKLPSILADIITSYIIYRVASKEFKPILALLLSGFYLFNPAVIINSTVWGQVDSFFTMLIVIALLLLKAEKKPFSAAVFTIAVLMKPQALIFIPVLGYELLMDLFKRKNYKNFILSILSSIITALIIIIPFSSGDKALSKNPLWVYDLFMNTKEGYKFASVNAYNLFSALGANRLNDSETLFIFSYGTWGYILAIAVALFSGLLFLKAKDSAVISLAALVQITGFFVLWTRMHERYMFPAVAIAILAYIYLKDIRILALFGGFSLISFLNAHDVLYRSLILNNSDIPATDIFLQTFSLLNVLLFCFLVKVSIDIIIKNKIINISPNKNNRNTIGHGKNK